MGKRSIWACSTKQPYAYNSENIQYLLNMARPFYVQTPVFLRVLQRTCTHQWNSLVLSKDGTHEVDRTGLQYHLGWTTETRKRGTVNGTSKIEVPPPKHPVQNMPDYLYRLSVSSEHKWNYGRRGIVQKALLSRSIPIRFNPSEASDIATAGAR